MIPKHDESGRTPPTPAEAPQRLVLDTNVCLDLFVFRDPRWQALQAALTQGSVCAFTRADCRMEWQLVLAYPKLGLDDARRALAAAEFDALIELVSHAAFGAAFSGAFGEPSGGSSVKSSVGLSVEPPAKAASPVALPVCKDPDDQKFLELAASCGADVLITKDKALLKLARRMKKLPLFRILTPEQWTAEWLARMSS